MIPRRPPCRPQQANLVDGVELLRALENLLCKRVAEDRSLGAAITGRLLDHLLTSKEEIEARFGLLGEGTNG